MIQDGSPPSTPKEALVWAKEALLAKRYIIDPHFQSRLGQRGIAWRSAWYAIQRATSCVAYVRDGGSLAGGTTWRIKGTDLSEEEVTLGVETFIDHLGRRLLLVTVF
jgi:hypothetical protein